MDDLFVEPISANTEDFVPSFATVAEVVEGGVTLIFPGEDEPSGKVYKCARGIQLQAGDRVHLLHDSGTFVVEYALSGDVEFQPPTASVTMLENGTYAITLTSTGILNPSKARQINLGSAGVPFRDLYASGIVDLGGDTNYGTVKIGGSFSKIGFFGKAPTTRKSLASTATLAQLIQALKDYGLFV